MRLTIVRTPAILSMMLKKLFFCALLPGVALCLASVRGRAPTQPADFRDALKPENDMYRPGAEKTFVDALVPPKKPGFSFTPGETGVTPADNWLTREWCGKIKDKSWDAVPLIKCLGLPLPEELPPPGEDEKEKACTVTKELFADGLKRSMSDRALYRTLASRRPDVWVFGEYHGLDSSYQADIIRKVRAVDPRVDCFFAEFAPGREGSWSPGRMKESDGYAAPARAARESGMKIWFIDGFKPAYKPFDNKDPADKKMAYHIYVRNKGMADEIERHLLSGTCHAGLYIVGKGHQYSSWNGVRIKTLQGFIREAGRSAVSINLVITDYVDAKTKRSLGDEFGAFGEFCRPELSGRAVKRTGFLHENDEKATVLYDSGGVMSDFDATIFR